MKKNLIIPVLISTALHSMDGEAVNLREQQERDYLLRHAPLHKSCTLPNQDSLHAIYAHAPHQNIMAQAQLFVLVELVLVMAQR